MKVILLKDVKGIGRRYEEKMVSDGYAMNSLLPKKLAVQASGAAAAQIRNLKENDEKHRGAEEQKLSEHVHKLANTTINVSPSANEQGHLFAALTREKISEILKEKGIEVPADCIELGHPIKEIGPHIIPVKIGDKETQFTLIVENK